MGFTGTTVKCKVCDKTVHAAEMAMADGIAYHRTCFRCTKCNGLLVMGNHHALGESLYCKPHFEQILRSSGGSFSKKSESSSGTPLNRAPSKVSSRFSGTQEKCSSCNKTVYPLEKVTAEGAIFHRTCFRCTQGGCLVTPASYAALEGKIYCTHHFSQLFKERGNYNLIKKSTSGNRIVEVGETGDAATEPKTEPEPEPDEQGPN